MAANLHFLIEDFQHRVEILLDNCRARGAVMIPYFTTRTPYEQARLWRQSRATDEIKAKIIQLRADGAPFLAHCLESVGPQNGPPVTHALPGFSFHQWGEALDSFWNVDGRAIWSTTQEINGIQGYHVYAEEAKKLGLEAGGYWMNFQDWPHVQLRKEAHPGKLWPTGKINDEMEARFR